MLDDCFRIVLIGVPNNRKKVLPTGITTVMKTDDQNELAMYYSMADVFLIRLMRTIIHQQILKQ